MGFMEEFHIWAVFSDKYKNVRGDRTLWSSRSSRPSRRALWGGLRLAILGSRVCGRSQHEAGSNFQGGIAS